MPRPTSAHRSCCCGSWGPVCEPGRAPRRDIRSGGCRARARAAPTAGPQAAGQSIGLASEQLDGLDWTFVLIRYSSWEENLRVFRATYWTDPWAVDGPAAEQNLSRRLGGVTAIHVNDPITLTLADERLWEYPWIYFVEPGNLRFTSEEVEIVREFLLRGGTATFDDFHGPTEWDVFQREMKRVLIELARVSRRIRLCASS